LDQIPEKIAPKLVEEHLRLVAIARGKEYLVQYLGMRRDTSIQWTGIVRRRIGNRCDSKF
jgi:hypothetical protein